MARDTASVEILSFHLTATPTSKQVLQKAYKLIERREHWCCGVAARPAGGGPSVTFYHPTAEQFCGLGAVFRSEWELGRKFGTTIPPHSGMGLLMAFFNDQLGHKAILLLLRIMIRYGR